MYSDDRIYLPSVGKDLTEGALKLQIYFTIFPSGSVIYLSPFHVEQVMGVKKQQYSNAFKELVAKGYLKQIVDCCYQFYSTPKELLIQNIDFSDVFSSGEELATIIESSSNLANAFVYAILDADKNIIYIGKTEREVENRIAEHMALARQNADTELYHYLHTHKWSYEVLHESHNFISAKQLQEKEKYFIERYKPKYNYIGISSKYTVINS